MSQIMKAFTGIVMVMLMFLTAIGMMEAFLQSIHAQNIHAAMIDELENSHYARSVLEECFAAAESADYELEITLYSRKEGSVVCTQTAELPLEIGTMYMAKVTLYYPFRIAFLNVDIPQEIYGYAR